MKQINVVNEDPASPVLVEMKLSNGGLPFNDLPDAPGFPALMEFGQRITLELGSYREVLYRRSLRIEGRSNSVVLSDLYRFGAPSSLQSITRSIVAEPDVASIHRFVERSDCTIDLSQLPSLEKNEDRPWFYSNNVEPKLISSASYDSKKYKVRACLHDGGYAKNILVVLAVVQSLQHSQERGTVIIEAEQFEVDQLVGHFVVKKDILFLMPKTASHIRSGARYRYRGFAVPIEVNLTQLFEQGDHLPTFDAVTPLC